VSLYNKQKLVRMAYPRIEQGKRFSQRLRVACADAFERRIMAGSFEVL